MELVEGVAAEITRLGAAVIGTIRGTSDTIRQYKMQFIMYFMPWIRIRRRGQRGGGWKNEFISNRHSIINQ